MRAKCQQCLPGIWKQRAENVNMPEKHVEIYSLSYTVVYPIQGAKFTQSKWLLNGVVTA